MACWTASPRVASVIKANSICLSLVTPDLNPYLSLFFSRLQGDVLSLRRLRPEQAAFTPFASPQRSSSGRRRHVQPRLSRLLLHGCALFLLGVPGMSDQWTGSVPSIPQFLRGAQMGSRTEIRNHYEIRGESTDDCLASLCCRSCALTQEGRELELEEKSFSS